MLMCQSTYESRYQECIANGCSPKLADMLASQQGPALSTDTRFMSGSDDGFGNDEASRKIANARAAKAGVSTNGKRYNASLARYKGDPEAWIPFNGAKGYVRDTIKRRGWSCDGAVKVKAPEIDRSEKSYEVAPDIVERETHKEIVEKGLKLTPSEKRTLRGKTADRLAQGLR